MLREKVGYRISFEPVPEAAAYLRKRAAGDPRWVVEEMAVSKEDGQQSMNVMSDSQFSSLSTPQHDEIDLFVYKNSVKRVVPVKTENLATTYTRLREQFGFKAPFLKMDTQGFDVEIVPNNFGYFPRMVESDCIMIRADLMGSAKH